MTKKAQARLVKGMLILIVLIGIFSVGFIYALSFVDVSVPTETTKDSVIIEYNITGDALKELTYNWNGTNYTMFDSSLILFYNFDNRSNLGEDDTTVKDLSIYGNNGSITAKDNVTWILNGKYDGTFYHNGFSTSRITVSDDDSLDVEDVTVSFWVLFNASTDSQALVNHIKSAQGGWDCYMRSMTSQGVRCYISNASTNTIIEDSTPTDYSINTWYHITLTYNSTDGNTIIYRNGIAMKSALIPNANMTVDSDIKIGGGSFGGGNLNGSIDNLMFFNRSLTEAEILHLYRSSLTKHSSNSWNLSVNESGLVTGSFDSNPYTYFISATNSSDDVNMTVITTLNVNPVRVNLTSNFTTLVGIVRDDFYGVNVQSPDWITGARTIDKDDDGTRESTTNATFHKEELLGSKMNYQRYDMGLHYWYSNTTASDGVNLTYNITQFKQTIEWASNNNIKVLLIIDYMPDWLMDNSSGFCKSADYCPPQNYTIYNNIVLDFLHNVTSKGKYNDTIELEFWNEPYGSFFMGGDTYDSLAKAKNYTQFYNETYTAVKAVYPTIPFGGPSGHNMTKTPNLFNTFLSNMSDQMDFVSLHPYNWEYLGTNRMNNAINQIVTACGTHNANCSRIILSEWQPTNTSLKNESSAQNDRYKATFAVSYLQMLNSYPQNISSQYYHWTDRYSYFNNPSNYPEYPEFWTGVSEKGLDDKSNAVYYPGYNITKDFTTYCPSGSTVYSSDSDDGNIKLVTCKKGEMRSIILINKDVSAKNVTLDLTSSGITTLTNMLTDTPYTITGNSVNLNISSYDVLYLGEDLQGPTFTINSPLNKSYSTQGTYFNITVDEKASWCAYSLNGAANITMIKDPIESQWKANDLDLRNGIYKVIFTCNDTSNNYNVSEVSFKISISGGGGPGSSIQCNPLWICDVWSYCSSGVRERVCVDINHCSSQEKPPLLLSCSQPLVKERIVGCVDFSTLDKIIIRWKLNIFKFDTLNEAIYKWKKRINC